MRATAMTLAVLALAAPHALAEGMPQGMPDLRQMSGIPRPDPQVAAGGMTVLVVRGEFSVLAAPDTRVHLVSVARSGAVEKRTDVVGDDGRIEWKDLATDGTVSYYALCLLGDDRLESDAVSPAKTAGTRVMLAGGKLDKDGKPVGPSVDDQKRFVGGPAVPAGEVWVDLSTEGKARTVELVEIGAGTSQTAAAADGTEPGSARARFSGIAGGEEHVYLARVRDGARLYQSRPFMLSNQAGAMAIVVARERPLLGMHAGAQLDDDRLWFEASFALANLSGTAYDPGPDGLFMPLPAGFSGASVKDEAMAQKVKVVEGKGLVWQGAVPPGEHSFTVGWAQKVEDGRMRFEMAAPLGLVEGQVVLEYVPGATVTPPSGVAPRLRRLEGGRDYWILSGFELEPGETLSFEVAGLPQADAWLSGAGIAAGGAVLLLLAWGLWAIFARTPVAAESPDEGESRAIEAKRERLFAELVSLERAHAEGRVDDDAYQKGREGLVGRLAAMVGEAGRQRGGAARGEGAQDGSPASP